MREIIGEINSDLLCFGLECEIMRSRELELNVQ